MSCLSPSTVNSAPSLDQLKHLARQPLHVRTGVLAVALKSKTLNAVNQEAFNRHILKTSSCWLWQGPFSNTGYGIFKVNRKMCLAHRIAYTIFIEEIPIGRVVCH